MGSLGYQQSVGMSAIPAARAASRIVRSASAVTRRPLIVTLTMDGKISRRGGRLPASSNALKQHGPAQGRPGCSVELLGGVAVRVVARFAFVREPAVGPDLRGTKYTAARLHDDPERLVVQYEGQACHERRSRLPVAGPSVQAACRAAGLATPYPATGKRQGGGRRGPTRTSTAPFRLRPGLGPPE